MKEITDRLYELQDSEYRDFQSKLIPTVSKDYFIGVRTPQLRAYAKELAKSDIKNEFLDELPHEYFDENQLHAFIISLEKDFDTCIKRVVEFLPYVNNWATCDQMSPKVFKKHKTELLPYIDKWLKSDEEYTVRFGVGMLMEHYLDDDFDEEYMKKVAAIRSDKYYINMMAAWYFATALAKQYDTAIKYIENRKLDEWTHKKAIQKARESYRITPEQKEYLKTLILPKN
ncbi:MAG: DNA alkylation repair protein [Eubacterium sp.]|nr:DNA alkylation repair protein [Eubacterium sp.]